MTNPRALRLSLVARLAAGPGSETTQLAHGASVQGTRGQLAVDDLVASHCDAVYRYALRLTRYPQQADDLTQETLLRGWQHRRKLRDLGAARVWLLQIATNLHRDGVRSPRSMAPLPFEASSPHPGPGVEGRLEQRECVARALTALDRLPARQRQVMHLVTIEQLSNEATAEVLGISIDAVKASLSLGRQAMRVMLRDVYEDICGTRVKTE